MDFVDEIKAFAAKIPDLLPHIQNEAQTRSALVEPFLRILGYDPNDPREVAPEYGASVKVTGVKQDERLDYALLKDLKPIILIECKPYGSDPQKGYGQLFAYFTPLEARIGVLTNGVIYKFYADLEQPNKMDEKPFLELDMLNLQDSVLAELKKLSKIAFNLDEVLTTANELKYTRGIMNILAEQLQSPSDEFVKLFFSALRPGKPFMGKAKESFTDFTKRAFKQFIRDQLNSLIKEASELADTRVATAAAPTSVEVATEVGSSESSERQISTTEEELETFYIVKSIVREVVDPSRIFYRDTLSYFGILLDDNNRKPICRLHLNSPQNKKISLFNPGQGEKQEEKIPIAALNDIYKYADRLKATVAAYEA